MPKFKDLLSPNESATAERADVVPQILPMSSLHVPNLVTHLDLSEMKLPVRSMLDNLLTTGASNTSKAGYSSGFPSEMHPQIEITKYDLHRV